MANRVQRIPALIDRNLRDIITRELKNPRIGFVAINEVEVSADYSHAYVYVSFLGVKYPKQHLEELNKTKGYIRSSLAKKMDTRKVPEIDFILDDSFDKASHLEEVLSEEKDKLENMKK